MSIFLRIMQNILSSLMDVAPIHGFTVYAAPWQTRNYFPTSLPFVALTLICHWHICYTHSIAEESSAAKNVPEPERRSFRSTRLCFLRHSTMRCGAAALPILFPRRCRTLPNRGGETWASTACGTNLPWRRSPTRIRARGAARRRREGAGVLKGLGGPKEPESEGPLGRKKTMRVLVVAPWLGTYPWYKVDETVEEAMDAMRKTDGIRCVAFVAMKLEARRDRARLSWRIGR